MSKNQNEYFIKNLDLQKAEEEFEQMMKQMEEDKKNHDFSIPKEWDDDFRAVMDEVLENKAKKKGINVRSKFAMAAGLAFVVIAGTVVTTETVQGNRLLDIFGKTSETGDERFEMYGTKEDFNADVVEDEIVYFSNKTLDELYVNIREELKRPIFQLNNCPIDYEVEVAEYDKLFNVINVQLAIDDGWVYISQEERLDEGGAGYSVDEKKCSEIWNQNLQQKIEIYAGEEEQYYSFIVCMDNDVLCVRSISSLENCEKIAQAFIYQ